MGRCQLGARNVPANPWYTGGTNGCAWGSESEVVW